MARILITSMCVLWAILCYSQDTLTVQQYLRTDGADKIVVAPTTLTLSKDRKTFRIFRNNSLEEFAIKAVGSDYRLNAKVYSFQRCGSYAKIVRDPKGIKHIFLRIDRQDYYFGEAF